MESEAAMDGINARARRVIGHLCDILDAGERGYAVAAANVNNRALKMLFKTYAQQRARFKAELQEQAGQSSAGFHSPIEFMAMIHRGRINIFAAMTIGDLNRERVVLKEVLLGERAALRAYRRALDNGLPGPLQHLIRRQYSVIQETVGQVELMRGKAGKQVVVRLYDSDAEARRAAKALQDAGFEPASMEKIPIEDATDQYHGQGNAAVFETILSGAAGGALWGSVSGALAGFGVVHLPTLGLLHAPLAVQEMAWAQTALGAIFAGGFVGAVLDAFIGWGIQGGDTYLYNESQRRGRALLKLQTSQMRAAQADQIMAQINREAQSHGPRVMV